MSDKRVVVVGGGVAGASTTKLLEDFAKVTLVDPKEYFEVPFSLLRSIVEPEFGERTVFKHADYLKKAELVIASAKSATETEVVTTSGDRLPYDYLVIATGTTYEGPATRTERVKYFQTENKKIKSAKTVLIIGGGPVGVELAAEIVVDFPDKKVILVHSGERLLDFLGPKVSKKTLSWLKSKKVEVILNERIDINSLTESTTTYTTNTGRTITADTHFVAIGKKVGSAWIHESAFKSSLDSNGRLKVDTSLRVEGRNNVFAIGDIANTEEIKQGYLALKHAQLTAENIKKLIKNPDSKLSTYKPLATPMGAVSLGRTLGVAQLPFGTTIGRLAGMIKSKDLGVGKTRQGLGMKFA
ncbi:hypothetical protein O6H91_03G017500 [Diphasiastrum complanatum]|uniref:Uncharacterized protein n=4 Tax=Diphasiastrum complanatum TaxID=34168 RepID=A0ACC2E420_DIPCM|nr:hypothetical protein O6H91_03G017500 [Diphasiastrum complanatum]KAJ7561188.1 hypothetical protein O6H91_03G017500 [Diphasiastrum complanatum]KAJ7561189.1 hypothetical protein O6H91_03G017500 [Diphasiastrum complanatum]KAJ7561190.1 hypothetical protein O6H91_03G017500 [Diphasiastrum complanatum]